MFISRSNIFSCEVLRSTPAVFSGPARCPTSTSYGPRCHSVNACVSSSLTREREIVSYSSPHAGECSMGKCCQDKGIRLPGDLCEFPTLGKASRHSHTAGLLCQSCVRLLSSGVAGWVPSEANSEMEINMQDAYYNMLLGITPVEGKEAERSKTEQEKDVKLCCCLNGILSLHHKEF